MIAKGAPAREIRDTKVVREALALAQLVLESENPIGEITGPAGTGKSMAGRAVADKMGALRLAAWDGMTRHQLLVAVAQMLGIEGAGAADRLLRRGDAHERALLVVDEANKCSWRVLETLRYLADESGIAVLLIGTELYSRKFAEARTRPLLIQLGSRIGAKRVSTRHLDRAETYAHVMRPAFGDVADRDIVTSFWQLCRKGNYREAVELAGECRRIMASNAIQSLTPAVLELAGEWMANRHAVGSDA
ncbi:ATP-binding protein [Calidifontimicrobium sp. SYSU G02091]|uniref:ATP-binding protein n=1 Tax=Calidifontimicrobium sp. SYSU G02091 TaxID=2926421 RepID=UPI001F52CA02|nr:ATP-binding protein [Calidifontimicrobium sp. SYSU G02091]MCI1193390.1 ATP-binding protein [Calidifontimicrobium sp. SYSU G02091]